MMRDDKYDRQALTLLQGRVACKLAEINQMLAPGVSPQISPQELQRAADRHMATLPPPAQEKLRMRALVAYAELERLSADMVRQLDILSEEISKVSRHTRAAVAYRQMPAPARRGLASL
jgi:hypothetical protein